MRSVLDLAEECVVDGAAFDEKSCIGGVEVGVGVEMKISGVHSGTLGCVGLITSGIGRWALVLSAHSGRASAPLNEALNGVMRCASSVRWESRCCTLGRSSASCSSSFGICGVGAIRGEASAFACSNKDAPGARSSEGAFVAIEGEVGFAT